MNEHFKTAAFLLALIVALGVVGKMDYADQLAASTQQVAAK